jgi:hypothetical protein
MMFYYSTSYHRSIKPTMFEVSFGLEPKMVQNPNPDLRILRRLGNQNVTKTTSMSKFGNKKWK